MKILTIYILFLLLLFVNNYSYAGKLNSARGQMNKGSKSSSKSGSSSNYDDPLADLAAEIITLPFSIPRLLLQDNFSDSTRFSASPYKYGKKGYLHINGSNDIAEGKEKQYPLALSIFLDNSFDLDSINRASAGFLLDSHFRLGLESTFTHFYEKLDSGYDSFFIYDANLLGRFAQNEIIQFYSGLGLRGLLDRKGNKYGINFTYFLNIYPVRPLSISLSVDIGSLGAAFFLHHKLKLGVILSNFEFYSGYDLMSIGNVDFFGPILGIQFWL